MYVLAMEVDMRVVDAHSLKEKRRVVKSVVEGARHRFGISAAEVGAQDSWQRARLGFAVVTSSARQADSRKATTFCNMALRLTARRSRRREPAKTRRFRTILAARSASR